MQVLEVTYHIGRRASTKTQEHKRKDIPVSIGTMCTHGGTKNILNRLAKIFDVKTITSKYTWQVYQEGRAGALNEKELESSYKGLYENWFLTFQAYR